MKVVNLEQGSEAWLSWRKTVITATEASILMGNNPWETPYKCWQRKLGLTEDKKSNEAMERGKKLEPIIRDRFIKKHGLNMTPAVVESSEYNFLGASLDGLSDCGKYILEIKTGNEKLYLMAKNGEIPVYYLDQMQEQLLVTGAEKAFYQVGHEDEEKDVVIEVSKDENFEKVFIPKAREFWRCVAFYEAPPLEKRDYKDMSEEASWNSLAEEYRKIVEDIANLTLLKEEYRKNILKLCGDENCCGNGIKVMKKMMPGRISYDEIPELQGVDLEKYRKSSTSVWQIMTR